MPLDEKRIPRQGQGNPASEVAEASHGRRCAPPIPQAARKDRLNSLNGAFGTDKDSLRRILQNADIAPHRRAETLDIDDFTRLTDEMIKAGEV